VGGTEVSIHFDERLPTYVVGSRRADVYAHFRSGLIVRAGRDRSRSYPGLRGAAPPTHLFYAILCRRSEVSHVLDLGCGSGEGTRQLTTRFERVTAFDASGEALAFAREFAPLARYVHTDVCDELPADLAQGAIVCDVLSQLPSPELALWKLRERLENGAEVLVAEPLAGPLQRLAPPARRGYSLRSLAALVVRGGFSVKEWITTRGSFVACIAVPDRSSGADALVRGLGSIADDDPGAAKLELERAATDGVPEVCREAHLALASLGMLASDGDRAVTALMSAAHSDPSDARPVAALAEIALTVGDNDDALRLALDAVRLDPTDAAAASAAARVARAVEHPDTLNVWRIAVNLAPDDFDLCEGLASLAAERGDAGLGIGTFERLRGYGDALDARFHTTLGWLLLAEGRQADAEIEAKLARASAPSDTSVDDLWRALRSSGVAAVRATQND